MNGELISKRDHSQETTVKLRHSGQKTEPVVLLWLATKCMLHDPNAHLFGEIRPASENIAFEVIGEPEI